MSRALRKGPTVTNPANSAQSNPRTCSNACAVAVEDAANCTHFDVRRRGLATKLRPWKVSVALRAWIWLAVVFVQLRRRPLPDVVRHLGRRGSPSSQPRPPDQVGRVVGRALQAGTWSPRCLYRALVLYRLLSLMGQEADFVIGLPPSPSSKDAHAWVEVDGVDVGPPPGRTGHVELVRYGR